MSLARATAFAAGKLLDALLNAAWRADFWYEGFAATTFARRARFAAGFALFATSLARAFFMRAS